MSCFLLAIAAAVLCIKLSASANITGRTLCGPGDKQPSTRKNTTEILERVRNYMKSYQINGTSLGGYMQYSADPHNTEYLLLSDYDKRVEFLTGFKHMGLVLITMTDAELYTYRVYSQNADDAIDCNWSLKIFGIHTLDTFFDSAGKYVGVDKTLINKAKFQSYKQYLASRPNPLVLTTDTPNPIDQTWDENQYNRPLRSANPINALDLKFAGVPWQEKIKNLRSNMTARGAGVFVVTALDEIAWLFNLRGSDTHYAPFFYAYAIVELGRISLYINEKKKQLQAEPTDSETKVKLYQHLGTNETGCCRVELKEYCLGVYSYYQKNVVYILKHLSLTEKIWITPDANYDIVMSVENNSIIEDSPVAINKAVKNPQERIGMRNANIRDSVGLTQFLAFLEKEIKSGKSWTEYAAAVELNKRRLQLKYNRGLSFSTMAGYGSNGALGHYFPSNGTDKLISTDSFLLLDSGGQYLDGTIDITRTMHYGQPTDYQKECYTRVLMAAINLAMVKWPEGVREYEIDALTFHQLWEVGLDYDHATGHGVGAYLAVHEGPGYFHYSQVNQPLTANRIWALEPAYYEEGKFGIRLEGSFNIVPFLPKYKTANTSFLQFDPITFVPFEPNLIEYKLLNQRQVEWLNEYNSNITKSILPLLKGDSVAIDWLTARTKPYNCSSINLAISGKLDMNIKIDL